MKILWLLLNLSILLIDLHAGRLNCGNQRLLDLLPLLVSLRPLVTFVVDLADLLHRLSSLVHRRDTLRNRQAAVERLGNATKRRVTNLLCRFLVTFFDEDRIQFVLELTELVLLQAVNLLNFILNQAALDLFRGFVRHIV